MIMNAIRELATAMDNVFMCCILHNMLLSVDDLEFGGRLG